MNDHQDHELRQRIESEPLPDQLIADIADPRLTAPNGIAIGNDWKTAVQMAARGAMARHEIRPPIHADTQARTTWTRADRRFYLGFVIVVTLMTIAGYITGYAVGAGAIQ